MNSKRLFVFEENFRLFVQRYGPKRVAEFTLTVADCPSREEFMSRWDSLKTGFLAKCLPLGFWVREIQGRGSYHLHCLVYLPFEIDVENFPWDSIKRKHYGAVQPELRNLWRSLREKLPEYGFGRFTLLPVRKFRNFAKYLCKYFGKAVSSDSGRCWGRWGKWSSYCNSNLTMLSNQTEKRKFLLKAFRVYDLREITSQWGYFILPCLRGSCPEAWEHHLPLLEYVREAFERGFDRIAKRVCSLYTLGASLDEAVTMTRFAPATWAQSPNCPF